MMDWDNEAETVSTPPAEHNQPEKINPEKETFVAAATGKSPSYKMTLHYADLRVFF
jgi:hypothetical protein